MEFRKNEQRMIKNSQNTTPKLNNYPFKDERKTALFKNPDPTAQ
jgi:hypothetical protein